MTGNSFSQRRTRIAAKPWARAVWWRPPLSALCTTLTATSRFGAHEPSTLSSTISSVAPFSLSTREDSTLSRIVVTSAHPANGAFTRRRGTSPGRYSSLSSESVTSLGLASGARTSSSPRPPSQNDAPKLAPVSGSVSVST